MKITMTIVLSLLFVSAVRGQVPQTLAYQGLLTATDGSPLPDGSYALTFRIYSTSSGGSALWDESKSLGITRGRFNTILGDVTSIGLPFDEQYWLSVQVDSDPELSPRMKLSSSAYSFRALSAEAADEALQVADNSISTAKIQNGAVTQAKLASGLTLPPGGTAGGDLTGSFPDPAIATGAVTSAHIADGTIVAADLANNAVTNAKLANAAVTTQKISSSGASSGEALVFNGTTVAWGSPGSSGLSLPFTGSAGSTSGPVLGITNTATSGASPAVQGVTNSNAASASGVLGEVSPSSAGAFSAGVRGINKGTGLNGTGVYGSQAGSGSGVYGTGGIGVFGKGSILGLYGVGTSTSVGAVGILGELSPAVVGITSAGVKGVNGSGSGVYGTGLYGVYGEGTSNGIYGIGESAGVHGRGPSIGVYGYAPTAVRGYGNGATTTIGVSGDGTTGVYAYGTTYGVECVGPTALYALGKIVATGTKTFQIDHPSDPANKVLNHYCAEGPEPLNMYIGNVTLDATGSATVELPEYFEMINKNFHYQLTPIGVSSVPYIAEKIHNNRFRISGGKPGQEISWRVDAVRNDLYVQKYGAPVTVEKSAEERGKYLQPELYGLPEERGIHYAQQQDPPVESPQRPASP